LVVKLVAILVAVGVGIEVLNQDIAFGFGLSHLNFHRGQKKCDVLGCDEALVEAINTAESSIGLKVIFFAQLYSLRLNLVLFFTVG